MQIDWTTFALEIVNFLVLVWILKRFLYQPVMAAVARRRAAIAQRLADAETRLKQSQDLERQYRERLTNWQVEKAKLQEALHAEIEQERARLMDNLKTEQAHEREKVRVLEVRRSEELQRQLESEALALSARFAARLLERLVSAALEARIIEAACDDLRRLPDAQRERLQAAVRTAGSKAVVTSAYPLGDQQHTMLTAALREAAGGAVSFSVNENSTLLAGLRIEIGPWVLRANLRDELAFFSEVTHEHDAGATS